MENHVDIARGLCTKSVARSYWEKFAGELNSLGPPSKSGERWLKVWTDFKYKTKKKMVANQKEIRTTGGGPNKLYILNALEQSVADLLNITSCVNPPGEEFGLETEKQLPATDTTNIEETDMFDSSDIIIDETHNVQRVSKPSRAKIIKKNLIDQRIELLQQQTELQ